MLTRELESFRDSVVTPRMMELLSNTEIPDGACYIDDLKVSFLDGRSCGHETLIEASGLSFQDGQVKAYRFSECDLSLNDFLAAHKDCVFLSDGSLLVSDELQEMELRTVIRNRQDCEKLFPEMNSQVDKNIEFWSLVFEKMKHLFRDQEKESQTTRKLSLNEQISHASEITKNHLAPQTQSILDHITEFSTNANSIDPER